MPRKLWWSAAAVACGIVAVSAQASAKSEVLACPQIAPTYCTIIDLSEICGPGCNVSIAGYN